MSAANKMIPKMPGVAAPESLLIPVTTADKTMKTTTMMIVTMIFVPFSMIEMFLR